MPTSQPSPQAGSTDATTSSTNMLAQYASARPASRSVPDTPVSTSKLKRRPRTLSSKRTSSPEIKLPVLEHKSHDTNNSNNKNIRRMSTQNSRTIRAAHIIPDCGAIVKELVENALDAHATRIEVRVRGIAALESITVSDNGAGIPPDNFDTLCLPSTTSKLVSMEDLQRLSTFGFRGEALSAIRAIASSVTVLTRTAQDGTATSLSIAEDGTILSKSAAARPIGTTVTVRNVFHALPVRRKDALQNAAREIARCVSVVQSLAIISIHTKLDLRVASDLKVSSTPRNSAFEVDFTLSELTLEAIRETARSILGYKTASFLIPVIDEKLITVQIPPAFRGDNPGQLKTNYACHALVSSAALDVNGKGGRAKSTHQFVYINKRPVDLPRMTRAANEVYRAATGLSSASPALIIALTLPSWACDVNLAPDKRRVLLHDEDALISAFVAMVERTWKPTTVNSIPVRSVQSTLTNSFLPTSPPLAPESALIHDELSQPPTTPSQKCVHDLMDIDTFSDSDEPWLKGPPSIPSPSHVTPVHSARELEFDLGVTIDANIPNSQDGFGATDTQFPSTPAHVELTPSKRLFSEFEQLGDIEKDHSPDLRTNEETSTSIQPKSPTSTFADHFRRPGSQDLTSLKHKRTSIRSDSKTGKKGEKFNQSLSQANRQDMARVLSARQRLRDGVTRPGSRSQDVTKFFSARSAPKEILSQRKADDIKTEPAATPADARIEPLHGSGSGRNVSDESIGASEENSGCSRDNESVLNEDENSPRLNEDYSIELDGPSDDVQMGVVRDQTPPVVHVDWNAICGAMSQTVDAHGDVKTDAEDKERVADFRDASVAQDESGSSDQGAADQELSRLFRQEWFKNLHVIGQFNLGFVIGRLHDDLFIIDQHASDEKYNFERLQSSTSISKQKLVTPLQLEFSTEDELLALQHMDALRAGGFGLSYNEMAPPTKRLSLISQPASKQTMFVENDLKDIVDGLRNEFFPKNVKILRPPRARLMFASRACRMSIMVGTALHKRQMQKVVRNLADIEHPWTCPHGRPTMRHLCTLH